jgi:hypothetical protein
MLLRCVRDLHPPAAAFMENNIGCHFVEDLFEKKPYLETTESVRQEKKYALVESRSVPRHWGTPSYTVHGPRK